jgi:hypothetical protein
VVSTPCLLICTSHSRACKPLFVSCAIPLIGTMKAALPPDCKGWPSAQWTDRFVTIGQVHVFCDEHVDRQDLTITAADAWGTRDDRTITEFLPHKSPLHAGLGNTRGGAILIHCTPILKKDNLSSNRQRGRKCIPSRRLVRDDKPLASVADRSDRRHISHSLGHSTRLASAPANGPNRAEIRP